MKEKKKEKRAALLFSPKKQHQDLVWTSGGKFWNSEQASCWPYTLKSQETELMVSKSAHILYTISIPPPSTCRVDCNDLPVSFWRFDLRLSYNT